MLVIAILSSSAVADRGLDFLLWAKHSWEFAQVQPDMSMCLLSPETIKTVNASPSSGELALAVQFRNVDILSFFFADIYIF